MCDFFTCIVTIRGDVLFTEEDSHDTVIMRAGLIDNLKYFVRIEYTPTYEYLLDEYSIPEWYERIVAKAKEDVKATYRKVVVAHSTMMKIRSKAFEEYEAFCVRAASVDMGYSFSEWESHCEVRWLKYRRIRVKAIQHYTDKIENIKGYVGSIRPTYISSSTNYVTTP